MADYKGLNIAFRADATEATKALHIISQEAKTAQGELSAAQSGLKNLATNGKDLNDALKSLQLKAVGEQARLAGEKANAYSQILEKQHGILDSLKGRLEKARDALAQLGDKWEVAGGKADAYAARVQGTMQGVVSATEALESCRQGTAEYAEAQERLADAQAANIAALEQYKAALDDTFTEFGTAEGRINSLETKERSVSESIERTNANMLEQQSQAKALSTQVEALNTALEVSQTKWGQFGTNAKEWGDTWKSLGDKIANVGDKMSIVSGVALATFGRNVITSTEDFGNSIAQLGGYLDISGTQLDAMREQALDWGKETQFSAGEAAQAMNELAKGGMSQAQISGGAMAATMELAAAGGLDMASAAETAVQAIKVFDKDMDDASAVADALAGAANTSTAEVSDLAQGFSQIGSAAGMAGWDLNEVTGALAILADHGFSGAEAGTTLKTTLQRLASPTKKAAETMQNLGIEVYGTDGKMKDALDVIGQFEQALDGLTDEQKNKALLDIFGMRGINGISAILDEGTAKFQEYIDATDNAGYAAEMAKSRMGDLGWALEYMRGEIETATVNFGQALAPTIIDVAKVIENAVEAFNNLDESTQENIAKTALFVAGIGPALSIVGHFTSGIGGMVSALGTGAEVIVTLTKSFDGNKTVIQNLASAYANATVPAEKVAEATSKIEKSMSALATGVAVVAAAWLAADLIGEFDEYVRAASDLDKATWNLSTALSSITADVSTDGLNDVRTSFEEIRKVGNELTQSQIDL